MYVFLRYLRGECETLPPLKGPQSLSRLVDETGVRSIGRTLEVKHRLSRHMSQSDLTPEEVILALQPEVQRIPRVTCASGFGSAG
jgi:hypothetical protein